MQTGKTEPSRWQQWLQVGLCSLPPHLCQDTSMLACCQGLAGPVWPFPTLLGRDSMVSGIISLPPSSDSLGVKPISVLCSV